MNHRGWLVGLGLVLIASAHAKDFTFSWSNGGDATLSYSIGYQVGGDFVSRKIDVDIATVSRAINDGFAKRTPTLSDEAMRDVLGKMQKMVYEAAKAKEQNPSAATPAIHLDNKDQLSYAIGYQIGKDVVDRMLQVDSDTIIRGLDDGFAGRTPTIEDGRMKESLARMQKEMYTKAKGDFDALSAANKIKSQQFLGQNRSKVGVIALPSGVQYQVIEQGSKRQHPTLESHVTLHFRSSLTDGVELDSSFARGEPFKFKVSDVITGWREVLPLMTVGDYWRVFVPPEFAYGERGDGRRVGPNEVMVFEMKLIDTMP